MTIKSGTGQACAACKYQRRRCTPECLLAPFFPADQPKMFQNVHRLFGVKHIQNLLRQLSPEVRVMAMQSIIFHANMRDKHPVLGCMVEIHNLTYQLQIALEQRNLLLQQLAYYRQKHMSAANDSFSQLQLGMEPPGNGSMPLVDHDHDSQSQYNADNALAVVPHANVNSDYLDSKENNVLDPEWIQQTHTDSMPLQSQMTISQPLAVQQEANQDYCEVHPFFDNFDDRQSFIDSKNVYESSFESSVKDAAEAIEQIAENELKSAAACFSLTSVN